MKKQRIKAQFQTIKSESYANSEALFDGEVGLPNYNLSIVKVFHRFLVADRNTRDVSETSRVLDFGAGGGHLAEIFKNRFKITPICIEIDPELILILSSKKYENFKGLSEVQYKISSIYCSNVLEHIADDSMALEEMANKLSQNGRLAIYVPALMFLYSELDSKAGHFRRYSKKELISKVSKAGFTVEECFYNDSLGVLASLLLKIIGYRNQFKLGAGKSLVFYDRVVYPVSRLLDIIGFKHLLGKNLFILAVKN